MTKFHQLVRERPPDHTRTQHCVPHSYLQVLAVGPAAATTRTFCAQTARGGAQRRTPIAWTSVDA
ncbi:hypothetical protein ACFU5O_24185 [Streptomyces sp. NPDC057445]|uniref:hypothetical protein n=1 Tax=Streptomyces sp. NPDC057445 TaxID=3346136 RepID=UPI0036CD7984